MAIAICHETSQEWLTERSRGIGGSDAPAILGISPFGGPARVAAVKLGYTVEDEESEIQRWGHYQEGPMIAAFRDETGLEAALSGHLYRRDDERSWMQATIDGTVTEDGEVGGIQCKLAVHTADAWDEGVPDYVDAQVQHEMAVMDWRYCYVLVLLRGYQFRWARVARRDEWIERTLIPELADFWRRVQAGEAVTPAGPPGPEWEALRARFPRPKLGLVARLGGPEWVAEVDEWRRLALVESAAKREKEQARNRIANAIGEAEFGEIDDGRLISLALSERAAYTVEATSYRTLRLVGEKRSRRKK